MIDRRISRNRRSGNERREYQRIQISTQVNFLRSGSAPGRESLSGTLYDVSSNGIRIVIDTQLSVGESLLLEVHNDGKHLFNSTSKVIWQDPEHSGKYSTGCELFVLLTKNQEEILSKIVDRTLNSNNLVRN